MFKVSLNLKNLGKLKQFNALEKVLKNYKTDTTIQVAKKTLSDWLQAEGFNLDKYIHVEVNAHLKTATFEQSEDWEPNICVLDYSFESQKAHQAHLQRMDTLKRYGKI